jgi:DNA-binding MarR family transcriptional regulator
MRVNRKEKSRDRDKLVRDEQLRHTAAEVLGRVFRQLNRIFGKSLRPHKLSPVDANLVARIWLDGPMKIGALQKHMAMSSSTFSGALDRAEKAGLLLRTPDSGDRRATILQPAPWPEERKEAVKAALEPPERRGTPDAPPPFGEGRRTPRQIGRPQTTDHQGCENSLLRPILNGARANLSADLFARLVVLADSGFHFGKPVGLAVAFDARSSAPIR